MKTVKTQINNLSLKDMDGSLLSLAILNAVKPLTNVDSELVNNAIQLAAYLHRSQLRGNRANLPRDTYITHPLRNTLRIIRYDCTVQDVIIASILHDTVEDHPFDMAKEFAHQETPSETEARAISLQYLTDTFGVRVSEVVEAVSNPIAPKNPNKDEARAEYANHVFSVIHDPYVLLVKFSDFVDNAVGLYHSTGGSERVQHLGKKYTPLVPAFRTRLKFEPENIPVSDEGLAKMKDHLAQGETRLKNILASA